jgi:hypothetical protein
LDSKTHKLSSFKAANKHFKKMKKLDNLEQFLKDNRSAFDNALPADAIWDKIEHQISETKVNVEDFISNNRAAFDSEIPSLDIWSKIENTLPQSNKIEHFITENRVLFDIETPHLKVWSGIEKRLEGVKEYGVVRMGWWRQAAAAVALLVVGAYLGVYFTNKTENTAIVQAAKEVAPDLNEAENFYNQKVESKLTQLVSYNPDPSPQGVLGTVMADLNQLDEIQEELKEELRRAPASTREEIVRRLIENYQIKLGILERVLNHIEEHQTDNQKIQQKNEKI